MKLFVNIFIFFIFLLCKASATTTILQKGENMTVNASDTIFFNSTIFEKNEEIKFEIRATSFTDENLYYLFLDDFDNIDYDNMLSQKPFSTKNENGYVSKLYTITKKLR